MSRRQDEVRPPTIADIARRCGVSVPTASRALRSDTRHGAEITERVRAAAREMGYDPARSHMARRLISQRFGTQMINKVIGFFFVHRGFSQSSYFMKIVQGVLDGVTETDFQICMCDQLLISRMQQVPEAYRRGDIDGIISTSTMPGWLRLSRLLESEPYYGKRPAVGLVEPMLGCSSVCADSKASGTAVIDHLLSLGHRHILHFEVAVGYETSVHDRRMSAYARGMMEAGIDPNRNLHYFRWAFGEQNFPKNIEALVSYLRQHPKITAIIAHNDEQAVSVHAGLTEAGYNIPEDLSLISYDDTDPVFNSRRENILTTVRLPLTDIGREGVKLLIRRILGEEKEDRDIILPVELMVRKSTAPPKTPARR